MRKGNLTSCPRCLPLSQNRPTRRLRRSRLPRRCAHMGAVCSGEGYDTGNLHFFTSGRNCQVCGVCCPGSGLQRPARPPSRARPRRNMGNADEAVRLDERRSLCVSSCAPEFNLERLRCICFASLFPVQFDGHAGAAQAHAMLMPHRRRLHRGPGCCQPEPYFLV